jgi:prevent-host-death family protein
MPALGLTTSAQAQDDLSTKTRLPRRCGRQGPRLSTTGALATYDSSTHLYSATADPSCTHSSMCTVLVMDETYPLVQARNELGQLVNRVRHGHETIVISDYGAPAAALIPVDELAELRLIRDKADIAEADRRKADGGPVVTHEAFMAELDAEDAQVAAS